VLLPGSGVFLPGSVILLLGRRILLPGSPGGEGVALGDWGGALGH
jgi:hypothetical protein